MRCSTRRVRAASGGCCPPATFRPGTACGSFSVAGARRACSRTCTPRARPLSGAGGPTGRALGRHPGQPECEDHQKRGLRGFDAGKKVKGRKRHLLIDTDGLLLARHVHAADDIQERAGARLLLGRRAPGFSARRLRIIWTDSGHWGAPFATWARAGGVSRSSRFAAMPCCPPQGTRPAQLPAPAAALSHRAHLRLAKAAGGVPPRTTNRTRALVKPGFTWP